MIFLRSGEKAKKGIARSQLRRRLRAMAGYCWPHGPEAKSSRRARRGGRFRLADRAERRAAQLAFLPRRKPHRVANQMHDAGLDHGLGQPRAERLGTALEPVDHRGPELLDPAILERAHHPQPELRALGPLEPNAQDS